MNDIDVLSWYIDRELPFVPKHFVRAPSPVSEDALFWVKTKLRGRYALKTIFTDLIVFTNCQAIYFEDPAECTMYELKWSSNKKI
jgi:hypothetical protein